MDTPSDVELQTLVSASDRGQQNNEIPCTKAHEIEPQTTLKEQSPSWIWRSGVPGTLIMIPLAYIVLIGIVACLHNKKENAFGKNVLEVLRVAATLWPISFAAVVGPFLKTLALYRAEKGSTLGALEFLLTTQTTASAFKNLIMIRNMHMWSIAIVAVWCLSPLGGQAAVRSLSLHPNSTTEQTPAVYYLGANISAMNRFYDLNGDHAMWKTEMMDQDLLFDFRNNIGAAFTRRDVLVSHANGSSPNFNKAVQKLGGKWQAARLGQEDLWGNIKIPFLELLPKYDSRRPEAWVPVPTDMVVPYASLIGLPIRRGSSLRTGNSTMVVSTRYQTVVCGSWFNGSSWLEPTAYKFFFRDVSQGTLDFDEHSSELQTPPTHPSLLLDLVNTTLLHGPRKIMYQKEEPKSKLSLILAGWRGTDIYIRTCDLSTSYVDIEVKCTRLTSTDDLNCRADRVRHASGFPIAGNLTALSNYFTAKGVIYQFPFATAMFGLVRPSLMEMYMIDPPSTYAHYAGVLLSSHSDYSLSAFEARFATALNTVIMASYNSSVLTGGDDTGVQNRNAMWMNSTNTWEQYTDSVYALDKTWFSIWLISTLVLFVSAIANVVIRTFIKAPDFLDSVIGLTRDSPFVEVSERCSGESASDRLQKLKHISVRICDVKSDADVGKIALSTSVDGRELAWERIYE